MIKTEQNLTIAVVGDSRLGQFHDGSVRGVRAELEHAARRVGCRSMLHVISTDGSPEFNHGIHWVGDCSPDLMVVVQDHLGQWSPSFYADWQRRFPLARWVTVGGAWCAGGARTGHPTGLSARVGRAAWAWQCEIFFRQFFAGQVTLWDPPTTRSTAERMAVAMQASRGSGFRHSPEVHLIPSAAGVGSAWRDVAVGLGWRMVLHPDLAHAIRSSSQQAPAGIWLWELDAAPPDAADYHRDRRALGGHCVVIVGLAETFVESHVRTQVPISPVEPADAFPPMGQTFVLNKPFLLPELQAAIGNLSL